MGNRREGQQADVKNCHNQKIHHHQPVQAQRTIHDSRSKALLRKIRASL